MLVSKIMSHLTASKCLLISESKLNNRMSSKKIQDLPPPVKKRTTNAVHQGIPAPVPSTAPMSYGQAVPTRPDLPGPSLKTRKGQARACKQVHVVPWYWYMPTRPDLPGPSMKTRKGPARACKQVYDRTTITSRNK